MTLLPASLRHEDQKTFSFLLAPLLGAAVWAMLSPVFSLHTPWDLPIRKYYPRLIQTPDYRVYLPE